MSSENWTLAESDPARIEIAKRASALLVGSNPEKVVHSLGKVTLADGREVDAHVVHAVDAVISDGKDVVMINRRFPPGAGKPSLPGGFMDPTGKGAESAIAAAAREALEEAGITLGEGKVVGERLMYRPHDVRIATDFADLSAYGIKVGDVFTVSTQAVHFDVPDLKKTTLIAGDDAQPGSSRRVALSEITREKLGIEDHFDLIHSVFPEKVKEQGCWVQKLSEKTPLSNQQER